jgi:putative endonuclease
VWEHKTGAAKGFTEKYGVKMLGWFETAERVESAIAREKNIRAWKRQWKLRLIEEKNPDWNDLYEEITGCQPALA